MLGAQAGECLREVTRRHVRVAGGRIFTVGVTGRACAANITSSSCRYKQPGRPALTFLTGCSHISMFGAVSPAPQRARRARIDGEERGIPMADRSEELDPGRAHDQGLTRAIARPGRAGARRRVARGVADRRARAGGERRGGRRPRARRHLHRRLHHRRGLRDAQPDHLSTRSTSCARHSSRPPVRPGRGHQDARAAPRRRRGVQQGRDRLDAPPPRRRRLARRRAVSRPTTSSGRSRPGPTPRRTRTARSRSSTSRTSASAAS